MHNWPQQMLALRGEQSHAVLVTVAAIRGSAPREVGSNMIVTEADVTGTIGGGYLENECLRLACAALRDADAIPARKLRRFALGSQCGQCCGGVVDVLFERVTLADAQWLDALVASQRSGRHAVLVTATVTGDDAHKWIVTPGDGVGPDGVAMAAAHNTGATQTEPDAARAGEGHESIDANVRDAALALLKSGQPSGDTELRLTDGTKAKFLFERVGPAPLSIVIFGAGHVGKACAAVFGTLDADVLVVDSRADYVDGNWPANTTAVFAETPAMMVAHCPADSYYLVMTHDHAIDLALCEAILARDDRTFCGLIGSRSKQRRFEKKLRAAGIDEATLASLTCPIGIDTIGGKQPGEIAIATAAQIVSHHQALQHARSTDAIVATANVSPRPRAQRCTADITPKPQAR